MSKEIHNALAVIEEQLRLIRTELAAQEHPANEPTGPAILRSLDFSALVPQPLMVNFVATTAENPRETVVEAYWVPPSANNEFIEGFFQSTEERLAQMRQQHPEATIVMKWSKVQPHHRELLMKRYGKVDLLIPGEAYNPFEQPGRPGWLDVRPCGGWPNSVDNGPGVNFYIEGQLHTTIPLYPVPETDGIGEWLQAVAAAYTQLVEQYGNTDVEGRWHNLTDAIREVIKSTGYADMAFEEETLDSTHAASPEYLFDAEVKPKE